MSEGGWCLFWGKWAALKINESNDSFSSLYRYILLTVETSEG